MRKIITAFILLTFVNALSQEDNKDVIKTSKIKKTTTYDKNGKKEINKIKVVTTETQENNFNPNQKEQLNQDKVSTPIEISRVIMIDNDKDPFYDKTIKVKFYKLKSKKYALKSEKNNLTISYYDGNKEIVIGSAIKSKFNKYYILHSKQYNGVGYFNKNDEFIIEYYNPKNNTNEFKIFEKFGA